MTGETNDLRKGLKRGRGSTAKERISKMPPCAVGKRSSIYRGVTRHRWTGRYEAHLWDKSTWNQNQNKKGKQVYLGAYDEEEAAARAYDLAALKYWGPGTIINFPVSDYARDVEEMQSVSREEYLASLRRKSSGFSRGMSKYRGIARPSQNGRWDTRFSSAIGNKGFNMRNLDTGEDAGIAYDMSQGDYISFGMTTNIDLTTYIRWWQPRKMHENDASASRRVDEPHSVSGERAAHAEEQETPERSGQACEPYQLPSLGLSRTGWHKPSPVTAGSILLQCLLFKQRLERASVREGNGGQDNNAYSELRKIRLEEEGRSLNFQEAHKVDYKKSGCISEIYQLPVQINAAHVPFPSCIEQCNAMHFRMEDTIGTILPQASARQ